MNLSNNDFSLPLEDTPGSLFGDVKGFPNYGGARSMNAVPPSRGALAKWCGFATEAEFLNQSRKVATFGSTPWFATPDKVRGGWVIWRDPSTLLGHPKP